MATTARYRPVRVLVGLLALVVLMCLWAFWPGESHVPRLGLDLKGGTQVILAPTPIEEGGQISEEQLQQTVEIIRARVNGVGVAEADITVQGSGNDSVIVVSVPGVTQDRIVELVGQTALLNFRPVETILQPDAIDPEGNPIVSDPPSDSEPAPDDAQDQPAEDAAGQDADGDTPADSEKQETSPTDESDATDDEQTPAGSGGTIVQSEQDDEAFLIDVLALDCTLPENRAGGSPDNPALWLGTCDQDGLGKYVLQPAFIEGRTIEGASAQLPQNGVGNWIVVIDFDSEGAQQLADASTQLSVLPPPQNQFAIVLDGVVISAPQFTTQILGGSAQIEGNFTQQEAQDLAQVLQFGALPLTLEVQAVEGVSPTLGSDQLRAGILAGLLGLALVAVYLFFYYRVLGIVAIFSLIIAALLTYASFVVLGRTIDFTLTLAGVAGAIVAIGITADSFVVYFERIRDELRDGKSLRRAADAGWLRARRTLLAADFVSFLAAAVLYWLSVGNVRGFAFALGLTTVMDVIVAFLFTRPLVAILVRSSWMQKGSWLSGVSPERLGVESLDGVRREKGTRGSGRPIPAGRARSTTTGSRDGVV